LILFVISSQTQHQISYSNNFDKCRKSRQCRRILRDFWQVAVCTDFRTHTFTYQSCSGVRFIVHAIFDQTSVVYRNEVFANYKSLNSFRQHKKCTRDRVNLLISTIFPPSSRPVRFISTWSIIPGHTTPKIGRLLLNY